MAENSFSQRIVTQTLTGRRESDLTHATYFGEATKTTEEIRDSLALKIKAAIQPMIIMLVVRFDEWETYISPGPMSRFARTTR
jgi:hypothetical protein